MADDLRVGILGYGIGGRVFHAPLVAATPGLTPAVILTRNGAAQVAVDYPEAAIEAGVPVVVDKPFAPTAAEAQQVVDAAAAKGVGLTVFQNRRLDSDFLTVRKVLDSGRLGDVFRFESRYDRWVPKPKDNWREFGDPAEAGGLLYDLGAHIVDQALQLFGPVETVYAEVDRRRAGDEGWGTEPASDAGKLGVGEDVETVPTEVGRYQDFYAQVRDALRGEAEFPVDPASAVAALRVIEAARQSSVDGRIVTL